MTFTVYMVDFRITASIVERRCNDVFQVNWKYLRKCLPTGRIEDIFGMVTTKCVLPSVNWLAYTHHASKEKETYVDVHALVSE